MWTTPAKQWTCPASTKPEPRGGRKAEAGAGRAIWMQGQAFHVTCSPTTTSCLHRACPGRSTGSNCPAGTANPPQEQVAPLAFGEERSCSSRGNLETTNASPGTRPGEARRRLWLLGVKVASFGAWEGNLTSILSFECFLSEIWRQFWIKNNWWVRNRGELFSRVTLYSLC